MQLFIQLQDDHNVKTVVEIVAVINRGRNIFSDIKSENSIIQKELLFASDLLT